MKLKAICCLLTVLGAPAVFGEGSGLSPDPSAIVTGPGCRAACEEVYADCEMQCRNTSARAHERAGEIPDLPVAACLEACAENLRLCAEDC